MNNDTILKYFNINIKDTYETEYGVFALLSEQKLPELIISDDVSIVIASSEDEQKIKKFDNKEWGYLPAQLAHKKDSDLIFLLYYHNQPAGYLHANINYKNIYDISNVFVHQNFRGNRFGSLLTIYYAHYCLDNGFIPHYGSAISKYSENVAIQSGFEETSRSKNFKISNQK